MRAGLLEIYHRDLPFFMPHWNVNSNSAVFDAKDTQLIISLSELDDTEPDFYFQICFPLGNFANEYPDLVSQSFLDSISIVSTNLSQIQLAQLYAVCDCYVSPYRAECFNLPVLKALSCGKQIIVSSGGSTDDFCHGAAVRRSPSASKRGPIGRHNSACWVIWPPWKI